MRQNDASSLLPKNNRDTSIPRNLMDRIVRHIELLRNGVGDSTLLVAREELDAARAALAWTRKGDLLVLPIHDKLGRAAVVALLDQLAATDWKPCHALPASVA